MVEKVREILAVSKQVAQHFDIRKLLGIVNVDFDVTGQLLFIYSTIVKYLGRKREYNEAMHQLFIDFKEAYDSVRGAVL